MYLSDKFGPLGSETDLKDEKVDERTNGQTSIKWTKVDERTNRLTFGRTH